MINQTVIKAHAKINLSLNITGIKENYHTLESVMTSVDLADVIVLRKRTDGLCRVKMSADIPPLESNAYRAAAMFCSAFNAAGADIEITNNIVQGSGLGGSAADAAGVLLGMQKLYGADGGKLRLLARQISSDTPYLMRGGFALVSGTGEAVQKISSALKLYFLAVTPADGVSTKLCFDKFDELTHEQTGAAKDSPAAFKSNNRALEAALKDANYAAVCNNLGNMLLPAAKSLNLQIGAVSSAFRNQGLKYINMSGSGSTVYAAFDSLKAAQAAKEAYSGPFTAYIMQSVIPDIYE